MSEQQQTEINNIGNLLARTADLAEQAGITGTYEDGAKRSIQQYNLSVTRLENLSAIPPGFFLPLGEEGGFGEVGIACAQLAAYLGVSAPESSAIYHGPKYNVQHNHKGGLSTEEVQDLQELREILQQLKETKLGNAQTAVGTPSLADR